MEVSRELYTGLEGGLQGGLKGHDGNIPLNPFELERTLDATILAPRFSDKLPPLSFCL